MIEAAPGGAAVTTVLRDVDLTIPAGRAVAIVGDNGAGKTTLVKLLAGFYEPTEGRITVDGVDLRDMDVQEWRRRISACMQDFVHFEFVARQSVGLGDVRRIGNEGRIMDALARASATDVVAPLPAGLETQLGREYEDGVELSAGQRQKLALGRRQRGHRCCSSWTSRRRASTHTPSTRSSIDTPGRRSARAVRWARSRSWCRTGSQRCGWPIWSSSWTPGGSPRPEPMRSCRRSADLPRAVRTSAEGVPMTSGLQAISGCTRVRSSWPCLRSSATEVTPSSWRVRLNCVVSRSRALSTPGSPPAIKP
jgi:GTPase SAR1 family protein